MVVVNQRNGHQFLSLSRRQLHPPKGSDPSDPCASQAACPSDQGCRYHASSDQRWLSSTTGRASTILVEAFPLLINRDRRQATSTPPPPLPLKCETAADALSQCCVTASSLVPCLCAPVPFRSRIPSFRLLPPREESKQAIGFLCCRYPSASGRLPDLHAYRILPFFPNTRLSPPPPLQQHHRRRTTQNRVRLIDPTKLATPILTTLSTVLSPRRRAAGSPASFPASALPRQDWSRMTIKFGVLVSQNHQSRFERRQSAYPQVFAWSFE